LNGKRSGPLEEFQAQTLAAALKLVASARMLDQDSDRMHPFTNGSRFRVLFGELIIFDEISPGGLTRQKGGVEATLGTG
jgi:hypothetical protein